MISAYRKITSKNRIEKLTGFLFYISLIVVGYLLYSLSIGFKEQVFYELVFLKLYAIAILSCFAHNIRDFKNPKKLHTGTLQHFISSINANPSGAFVYYKHDSYTDRKIYFRDLTIGIFLISGGFLFFTGLLSLNQKSVIVSLYSLMLFAIVVTTIKLIFNRAIVSPETLEKIDSIEDIPEYSKRNLKSFVISSIENNGYITKDELYFICNKMYKDNERQLKNKEQARLDNEKREKEHHIYLQKQHKINIKKEKYSSFLEKNKYI